MVVRVTLLCTCKQVVVSQNVRKINFLGIDSSQSFSYVRPPSSPDPRGGAALCAEEGFRSFWTVFFDELRRLRVNENERALILTESSKHVLPPPN